MFLELMTMWERERKPSDAEPESKPFLQQMQKIFPWTKKTDPSEENLCPEPKLPDWKSRRIGILFSKQPTHWVFLIFFEPILNDDPNYQLTFTFRKISHTHPLPHGYEANVHGSDGPMYFEPSKENLANTINFIITNLRAHPGFLKQLMRDVFWEWEEYFQYVRVAIANVSRPCNLTLLTR